MNEMCFREKRLQIESLRSESVDLLQIYFSLWAFDILL